MDEVIFEQQKGCLSSKQEMPTGTPQGSRLSPLLFICLMADLDLWTNDCVIRLQVRRQREDAYYKEVTSTYIA